MKSVNNCIENVDNFATQNLAKQLFLLNTHTPTYLTFTPHRPHRLQYTFFKRHKGNNFFWKNNTTPQKNISPSTEDTEQQYNCRPTSVDTSHVGFDTGRVGVI